MAKDSPAPLGPEPPAQGGRCPRPAPGAALAVAPSAAFGRCAGGCHIASAPSPGAVTRLRSFAAEPVKESAIHSTGWAVPGVAGHCRARAPPRDGQGGEWGLKVFPSQMRKGKENPAWCVGKFIFHVTRPGGARARSTSDLLNFALPRVFPAKLTPRDIGKARLSQGQIHSTLHRSLLGDPEEAGRALIGFSSCCISRCLVAVVQLLWDAAVARERDQMRWGN